MSSEFLCDVIMPSPEPSPEPQQEQEIPESVPPEGEENPNFIYSDEEQEEDIIPEPVRKAKIPQEEIFSPSQAPQVKSIVEPKKVKKTRKPRGPATPEQLERLAKGREKAKETFARKKLEREALLETNKEDKEIAAALKERERRKLKKKLETPIEDDMEEGVKVKVIEKGFSKAELDDAVQRAVEQSVYKVETLRKQRKEVKKKAEAKQNHEKKVFKDINQAIKPSGWDACFF